VENNPVVGVCIPTYNNARYIYKTISSIIGQTYKNMEIIVCDNASTDNTEEIVKSFSDPRIVYYKNSELLACLANWNACIKKTNAEFVAIYHSDDIYAPEIVEKEVVFLQNHPTAGAVFCLDKLIDENGKFAGAGVKLPKEINEKDEINFEELFTCLLENFGSFLVAPTFMTRKVVFKEVGFFDESGKFGDSIGSAGDTEMWLRIARKYNIGIIKERLIQRRISSIQGSRQYNVARTTPANHFIVLDHFLNFRDVKEKITKNVLRQYTFNKFWDDVIIAKNLLKQHNSDVAKAHLLKSFSLNRFLTGFMSVRNFAKLLVYFFLLVFLILGVAEISIKFYQFVKRQI